MPTATSTITTMGYNSHIPLKSAVKLSSTPPFTPSTPSTTVHGTSSSAAPLRSLYNRAARAFLHREIPLTHSLIQSAFHLLKPPVTVHDSLLDHRRKWDILRITLETTIYADPPAIDSLPESLRTLLAQSPQTLMTSIYTRSVALFTPTNATSQKFGSHSAYLPPTVLITLLYSSLKLECPEIGRRMTEEWLSRRESPMLLNGSAHPGDDSEEGGYDKVLEIYCLLILPKLGQWDYAKEFLQFESELSEPRREFLKSRLNAQNAEALVSNKLGSPSSSPASSHAPTPRSHSPAPSASSSSSLSTTSTHTVTPSTPWGGQQSSSNLRQSVVNHSSSSSDSSEGTATPRGKSRQSRAPNGIKARSRSTARTNNSSSASTSSSLSSAPRTVVRTNPVTSTTPNVLSLVRSYLAPHLTTSKITTFVILFILFPLLSWVLRVRHRRRKLAEGAGTPLLGAAGPTNVDLVRKRLQAAGSSDSSIVVKVGREVLRVVIDTVKMAGRGLV
ncbi:hypothetical protein D9611_001462 [Ephemerocybe angulata]|uniref:Uncharacterized protein n=1 Tax=Ephemerocybe angulata TaxID=980116 RepID=A0A8H5CH43_9AGAR|nr:hypothetical protein D9611_001462 [Tulosesus angulatus]